MVTDLTHLFNPASIALIGVSSDPHKRAGLPLRFLDRWYDGKIYPVNPNHEEIEGRTCYDSIKHIEATIDVALISLPAPLTNEALKECGEVGVQFAILITAGFAETEQGKSLQQQAVDIANQYGMRLVGPNCTGIINFQNGLVASYAGPEEEDDLTAGNVALISQSGALGGLMQRISSVRGLNFSHLISSGNEADLTTTEYINHLIDIPEVEVIGLYIEEISNGKEFLDVCRRAVSEDVPIVALKVGRSRAGAEAAVTHTASMTGDYEIHRGIFRQLNIITVEDLHELLHVCQFLISLDTTTFGENIGIITGSGGAGIQFADRLSDTLLTIPDFATETKEQLRKLGGNRIHPTNPFDLAGAINPDNYDEVVRIVGQDQNVDAVALFNIWSGRRGKISANQIREGVSEVDVPVNVVWPSPRTVTGGGHERLEAAEIPVFQRIRDGVTVLERCQQYSAGQRNGFSASTSEGSRMEWELSLPDVNKAASIPETAAKSQLREQGLSTPNEQLVHSPEAAAAAGKEFGERVVMKVVSPDIYHRMDEGLIDLNVSPSGASDVYTQLLERSHQSHPDATISGILVQEYVQTSETVEMIIGGVRRSTFGPTVMLGHGGIHAEQVDTVEHRVTPLSIREARDMIVSLSVDEMISESSQAQLGEVLVAISNIMQATPWLEALDCNPIILSEDDAIIVDALMQANELLPVES